MAISHSSLKLARMQIADLDDVMEIENAVHSQPWSRGNFIDSLTHDHDAWVVRSAEHIALGYFVQMAMVDESHLLTIGVKENAQGEGIGQFLLRHVIDRARLMQMTAVSLEVRASNLRALTVYKKVGFVLVGRRKNYYPIAKKTAETPHEDALILRYEISS